MKCVSGMRKRDELCTPLNIDDRNSLDFLIRAKEVFLRWRESHNAGLTKETFLACIQTIGAMIDLTKYLRDEHGFRYVLPGKFMSDPIEGRFGWYRQTSGGNFFMSVRQLMDTEKKIRILSLLQQNILYQAANVSPDLLEFGGLDNNTSVADSLIIDEFLEQQVDNLDELSPTDANVAYFVGGYIGGSICRRRKCEECTHLLLADKENVDLTVQDHLPDYYKKTLSRCRSGWPFCSVRTLLCCNHSCNSKLHGDLLE